MRLRLDGIFDSGNQYRVFDDGDNDASGSEIDDDFFCRLFSDLLRRRVRRTGTNDD